MTMFNKILLLAVSMCAFDAMTVVGVPIQEVTAPAQPNNKTYCCGVGKGGDCGSPDWTEILFAFNSNATITSVNITLDSAVTTCKAEVCKVAGTAVSFPDLSNKTDCLGALLRSTGALESDLVVTYDPVQDTVDIEIDSEGLTVTMTTC